MSDYTSDASYLKSLIATVKSRTNRNADSIAESGNVEDFTEITFRQCVNCGYELSHQERLGCPECGLTFARCYADPTPWAKTFEVDPESQVLWRKRMQEFVATCKAVILFDRRIAIRTSILPTTPTSRRFAVFACFGSMPLFGLLAMLVGYGLVDQQSLPPAAFLIGAFLFAAIVGGCALFITIPLLEYLFQSRWKRSKHRFVPSSVHYAYPNIYTSLCIASIIMVLFYLLHFPLQIALPLLVAAFFVWPLWVWNGVSQSGRHHFFIPRLILLCFASLIVVATVSNLWPRNKGPMPILTAQAQQKSTVQSVLDGSIKAVEDVVKTVAQPPAIIPKNYVLIIDAIVDSDDSAEKCLKKLCPSDDDRFMVMKGKDTTLANIRKAFEALKQEISDQDSFVLYINGHGRKEGNGYIQMENGYLSNQMLEDFLFDLKTVDRLLIIDSCYAGNFMRSLRNTDCAIVAATDRNNIAWTTGMQPLWKAWSTPQSDCNRDGEVDISEAIAHALADITKKAEEIRKEWKKTEIPWRYRNPINLDGYMSPQYNVFGKTNDTRFSIRYAR